MVKLPFFKQVTEMSSEMGFWTMKMEHSFFSKVKFAHIFAQHPDAVFAVDVKRRILHMNDSVTNVFGYKHSELLEEFTSYFYPAHIQMIRRHYKNSLRGEAQNFKSKVLHKDGHYVEVDFTFVPINDHEMNTIGIYAIAKDITKDILSEKEIIRVKNKLELAQKAVKMGSWDYDLNTGEVFYSQQMHELIGRNDAEKYVKDANEAIQYIHPEDRERYRNTLLEAIKQRRGYGIEYRIVHKDGSVIYVSEQAEIVLDEDDKPVRLVAMTQDITKGKLMEKKYDDNEKRFKHIYENLSLGIWSFDHQENEYHLITPGIEKITGYPASFFDNVLSWQSIIHPEKISYYREHFSNLEQGHRFEIQYPIIRKDGTVAWVNDKTIPVLDEGGRIIRIDAIISDITEKKEDEERILQLAYHDPVTQTGNRELFNLRMSELISEVSEKKLNLSIMYIDLDRFRNINNLLGHIIGDKLLKEFSKRVEALLDESSLLARIGGDEFAIILWNYPPNYPEKLAKMMIDSLKRPFHVEDYELFMTVSIGISTYPLNGASPEELVKNANIALLRAKLSRNSYHLYSASLDIRSYKQFELDKDLRKSIERDQLILYFQPRVDPSTGKLVAAEALIRWMHPVWGMVSPGEFIPLAEETGFINEIGDWVLLNVCQFLSESIDKRLPVVPISINLSAQRFLRNDWQEYIVNTINNAQINPELIEFEITETLLIEHEDLVKSALQFLNTFGVKIALDDFGTGYSSLSHLKDFAISTIKIDKSFTDEITKSSQVETIIKSLIYMAKGLEMNIVAEGVETMEQLAFLRQHDCHEIQGYLYSKPVPEETFCQLLLNMILKPRHISTSSGFVEKRKFFRVDLIFPLSADMTLQTIQGRDVKLGKTEVLIENIGPGGIRFISTMQLPVRPDIVYLFETTIMNQVMKFKGVIVWKNEVKGLFQYGIKFLLEESQRDYLIKVLNQFSIQMKTGSNLSNCRLINMDRWLYLRKSS